MEVQPAEISFYFLIVGVIRDRGLEPGWETSEFFSTAWGANDDCAELRVFLWGERGGDKIRESGAIFEGILERFLRVAGGLFSSWICSGICT